MEVIDRCVLLVEPKQPYLAWANSLPDADASLGTTRDSLRDDSSAHLSCPSTKRVARDDVRSGR
jgi:hypothetical protein